MRRFEGALGHPPGENQVALARRPGGTVLVGAIGHGVPTGIAEFFDVVEEVSLPDVWNGYFVGPVDRVISAYESESPRSITVDGGVHEVLVIGSDGGSALYCSAMREPGPVFRLDQVSIRHGIGTTPPGFTRELAPDFPGFLDALAVAIDTSAQGLRPPDF
jgi:hypothetical protein